jgi:hypothetical protein
MEDANASPETAPVAEDVKNFYSGSRVRIISNVHSY